MNSERWQRIEQVFHEALQLEAEARLSYLAQSCSEDSSLREEVESLIDSLERDGSFLVQPAFDRGLRILAKDSGALIAGRSVGPYQILSELGIGGMGEVYLAHDPRLGRKVAIKLLAATVLKDEIRVRRFRQEARAIANISHPNVASIYEIGRARQQHFIAMEFVDGITLRERLSQGPLRLKEASEIAMQVGSALGAAHRTGIIHRDIKPENIMLQRDGYVKVLDFGLAKLTEDHGPTERQADDQDSVMTRENASEEGLLMGTLAYMSPSQLRGQPLDVRTDIWSWGVVLYEMIAGEPPFQGPTRSDVLAEILKAEPALLKDSPSTLPASLKEILRRSLAKEKEGRYSGMREALDDLRHLQKQLDSGEDPSLRESNVRIVPKKDLSTSTIEPAKSVEVAAPPITDSQVFADDMPAAGAARLQTLNSRSEAVSATFKRSRFSKLRLSFGLAIFALAVFAVQWLRPRALPTPHLQSARLSLEGFVAMAVISPDGRLVASVIDEAGSRSVWVKQINTSSNLQILGFTKEQYGGLSFSPDGNDVYYLQERAVYRVSVLGGTPRKLIENVDTPVTFSPDGSRIAFVRASALITANSEGAEEKTLAELKKPQHFLINPQHSTGPAWSPDGAVIACPAFNETDSSHIDVLAVRVQDGSVRTINVQKSFSIRKLIWLADSSGLIMNAKDQRTSYQLWLLSYPDGEARRITNDSTDYDGLSATRDSKVLLTTKIDTVSSVWTIDATSHAKQIPLSNYEGLNGISWTPDGKIVYARWDQSDRNIWIVNLDGSGRKQLTFDDQGKGQPTVSADGRYTVFVAYREGKPHLWRVGIDGTDLKQLTTGRYEDGPRFSRDGQFVIYHGNDPANSLWKISINGGDPVLLTKEAATFPDVSPDGTLVAFASKDEATSAWKIKIIPYEGGPAIKTFSLPSDFVASPASICWEHNRNSLAYVRAVNGTSNIWTQPLSGDPPKQLTDFREGRIYSFACSIGGELVCARGVSTTELTLLRDFQ